jgi:hypothetical protein
MPEESVKGKLPLYPQFFKYCNKKVLAFIEEEYSFLKIFVA